MTEQEKFMKEAIRQAKKAYTLGEVPIGCVIVYDGKIIGRGYNRRNTDKNTLAHAEITAINKASKKMGDWRLEGCTLYVTLEPCQMCAGAIVQARIDEVVMACMNPKAGCGGSILNILEMPEFNHQVKVTRGVLETECSEMLKQFFKELRVRVKKEKEDRRRISMSDKKLVALTFDDGPTIGITDQVLDVLEENETVASFFLIGQQITDETGYLVKRAHDMGCSIENHSRTHQSMPTLSRQEILDEIQYTTDLIEEITGEKPEFFRPPYIDYDQKMYDLIDLGFIAGYGCEDWVPSVTAKERIDRVLHDANPGFIILLHDMEDNVNTVEAIKTIIPELKKQGYEFVTIRDLFRLSGISPQKNAIYMGANEVRKNYQ